MKNFFKLLPLILLIAALKGAAEDHSRFIINNTTQFKKKWAEERARYKAYLVKKKKKEAEKRARKRNDKIIINENNFKVDKIKLNRRVQMGQSQDEFFKKFGQHQENKQFKKVLIKNRSHINPQEYHYTVVKKPSDLENAGVKVDGSHHLKKVYNYVEMKNTSGKSDNIGVVVEKGGHVKKIVNIVEMKHSALTEANSNAGVRIENKKIPKKIYNSVEMKDAKLGGW